TLLAHRAPSSRPPVYSIPMSCSGSIWGEPTHEGITDRMRPTQNRRSVFDRTTTSRRRRPGEDRTVDHLRVPARARFRDPALRSHVNPDDPEPLGVPLGPL